MSARIKIELVFDVLDEDRLVSLAKEAIDQYGNGYECNPEDLADCAVELLLHSNPSIKSYDEYGLELIECVTTDD